MREQIQEIDAEEAAELLKKLADQDGRPKKPEPKQEAPTEIKRRQQQLEDAQALEKIRAQNLRREQDLSRSARKVHSADVDAEEDAQKLARAEAALILDFAVGGFHGSVGSLRMTPGIRLGSAELWRDGVLISVRTYESPLNPVFLYLPDARSKLLVAQLDAISKARVSVSPETLEWYRSQLPTL